MDTYPWSFVSLYSGPVRAEILHKGGTKFYIKSRKEEIGYNFIYTRKFSYKALSDVML